MRITTTAAMLVLVAGCEKNLLVDLQDAKIDAAPDAASTTCPAPTPPLASGTYTLYVNTEGVTLTVAGTCNDSRMDCTDIGLTANPTLVPPFLDGNPARQPYIDQIIATVQGALAPYSIDVVTARPAAGEYEMVVVGGDSQTLIGCVGCFGQVDTHCPGPVANRNQVSFVFDHGDAGPAIGYANYVLANLGTNLGLVNTVQVNDCQCRHFEPVCNGNDPSRVCTFGTMVPTTSLVTPDGQPYNCGLAVEDEPALLAAALGCR